MTFFASRRGLRVAAFLLVLAGAWLLTRRERAPAPAGDDQPAAGAAAFAPRASEAGEEAGPLPASAPEGGAPGGGAATRVTDVSAPPVADGPHAEARQAIADLSITYDPQEVPRIARYLTHEDADVRRDAVDGLVRLGAREGAEALRDAAVKLKDPREAVAMLDAAAYLELPSLSKAPRKRTPPPPAPRPWAAPRRADKE